MVNGKKLTQKINSASIEPGFKQKITVVLAEAHGFSRG